MLGQSEACSTGQYSGAAFWGRSGEEENTLGTVSNDLHAVQ